MCIVPTRILPIIIQYNLKPDWYSLGPSGVLILVYAVIEYGLLSPLPNILGLNDNIIG